MVATIAAGTTAGYYLQQSEYYLGGSEPNGRWIAFDDGLGVDTSAGVNGEVFERLHAGLNESGQSLATGRGNREDRTFGFDVTFSAPKSVSIAWGIGDEQIRQGLEIAQASAVDAALRMLDQEAAWCRRGRGGAASEKVHLTCAVFQHGEARPAEHADGGIWADPQLHSHAVVLNVARRGDGTFGALDGRALFRHKMAAGAVYHAQLAAGLHELGFDLEVTGKNGLFEIKGVDATIRRHFSARRELIEDEMKSHGLLTADAPELASAITRATRSTKSAGAGIERHEHWRHQLDRLGHAPEKFVNRLREPAVRTFEIDERLAAVPTLLTETESVFERRDIIATVAAQLVGTGAGSERVAYEVSRLVEGGAIVGLGRDALGNDQYSTPAMIKLEREVSVMAKSAGRRRGFILRGALVRQTRAENGLSVSRQTPSLRRQGPELLRSSKARQAAARPQL